MSEVNRTAKANQTVYEKAALMKKIKQMLAHNRAHSLSAC
jgi:hypothetical protein